MMSKYGSSDFTQTLTKIGDVSYDLKKNFTHYAGFLEGLMGGMFADLEDDKKVYYIKRAKEKLAELSLEQMTKFTEEVGEKM